MIESNLDNSSVLLERMLSWCCAVAVPSSTRVRVGDVTCIPHGLPCNAIPFRSVHPSKHRPAHIRSIITVVGLLFAFGQEGTSAVEHPPSGDARGSFGMLFVIHLKNPQQI